MVGAGSAMSLTESFSDTGLLSLKYHLLGKRVEITSPVFLFSVLSALPGLLWSISCSRSISTAKKDKFHQFWCFSELKISFFVCVSESGFCVRTVPIGSGKDLAS